MFTATMDFLTVLITLECRKKTILSPMTTGLSRVLVFSCNKKSRVRQPKAGAAAEGYYSDLGSD